MRRKEVSKRTKSISEVRASMDAHREKIGLALAQRPAAQGTEPLDYQPIFQHLDEELAAVERQLITAEDEHLRQLLRVVDLRRENSTRVKGVREKQSAARQILAGLYGAELNFELAGVSGDTPRVSQTLEEQVDQTTKLLRNPVRATPDGKIGGVEITFDVMADDLQGVLGQLQASREQYIRSRKVADGTRIKTNAAIAEVDRVFPWVAGALENCFRLAGEPELADRIRTSTRRITRRLAEPEEASESTEGSEVEVAGVEVTEAAEAAEVTEANASVG